MAFYNEGYSKACRSWIENNKEFYRHFSDAVKQLRLSGMLHVYDFALTNLPNRPQSVKVGDYGEVVWVKYEKIHSDFGVRSLISWPTSLSSWAKSKEDYVYAATAWLIHGDFYETMVHQIIGCYKQEEYINKDASLYKLMQRLVNDSIVQGIKTRKDWETYESILQNIERGIIVPPKITTQKGTDNPNSDASSTDDQKGLPVEDKYRPIFNLLKCNEEIRTSVADAIAKEIEKNNSGTIIAFIKFALEKKNWIGTLGVSFSSYYSALKVLVEGRQMVSRQRSSSFYSKYQYLQNKTLDDFKNADDRHLLMEINRIWKVLDNIEQDALKKKHNPN
ncbi:MAG: hypothetical protein IJV44_01685 [Prevotella sp.]|nr:hypothetical protein [Prevotella sp.]